MTKYATGKPLARKVDVPRLSFEDTAVAFADKSNWQLRKTYWIFAAMNQNWLVKIGTFFIKLFLMLNFPIKALIRKTVFEHFCGGETIAGCDPTVRQLDAAHIGTILDYSVEGEDSEASFDTTTDEVLRTIEKASQTPAIPFSVFKVTGLARTELLEIAQMGTPLDEADQTAFERVRARVVRLCEAAAERHVRIFFDAEETWIQDTIDALAYDMMARFNRQQAVVYNTYQLYRREGYDNLIKATEAARAQGYCLGVKLVRGAYMEKERQRAHELEYCDPIHATKEDTDADFNRAIDFCVENRDVISLCLGTHNEYSSLYLTQQMKRKGIPANHTHFWFAQLLGMSDNISYNLAKAGYNVAKYVPYGPVEAVMPYLFRRAAENTSVAGQSSREFSLVRKELRRRRRMRERRAGKAAAKA
jgi:proline dehydrogenase